MNCTILSFSLKSYFILDINLCFIQRNGKRYFVEDTIQLYKLLEKDVKSIKYLFILREMLT
jgi:hypothetical protein